MPGFDGAGPFGAGPFTGRSAGYCVVQRDHSEGKWKTKDGRAVFMPWNDKTGPPEAGPAAGRGGGCCARAYPYALKISPEEEACILKNREKALKRELKGINFCIETLKKLQSGNSAPPVRGLNEKKDVSLRVLR